MIKVGRLVAVVAFIVISFFQIRAEDGQSESMLEKLKPVVATLCVRAEVNEPAFIGACEEVNAYVSADLDDLINGTYTMKVGRPILSFWERGLFTDAEIEALCAHEVYHVKCNHLVKHAAWNTTFRLVVIPLASLFRKIQIIPGSVLVNLGSCAVSRPYEREADEKACELTGDPESFISMLIKIHCQAEGDFANDDAFKEKCKELLAILENGQDSVLLQGIVLFQDHPSLRQRITSIRQKFSASAVEHEA